MIFLIDRIEGGGAEKILLRIAARYKERTNKDVTIIINYPSSDPLVGWAIGVGIDVIFPNILERGGVLGKIWNLWLYLLLIFRKAGQDSDDLMLSFLERSNVVNILVSVILGKRALVSVRNNLITQYERRSWLEKHVALLGIRLVYRWAHKVIALSDSINRQLVGEFGLDHKKVHTIFNPYPVDRFRQLALEPLKSERINNFISGNYVIVSVGRLAQQKGQWHLLNIMPALVKYNRKIKLLILGDGPYLGVFTKFIEDNALADNILICQNVENPYSIIARSKVFVFPSLWEGFGNALMEALILNIPVVATDCPYGPKEMLGLDFDRVITRPLRVPQGFIVPPLSEVFELKSEPFASVDSNYLYSSVIELMKLADVGELSVDNGDIVRKFNEDEIFLNWMNELT